MKVGSGALQDLHVFSNLKLGKPVYESDTDPRTMNVVLVAVVLKCNLKIYTFDFFTVGNGPGTLELHAAGCAGAYGGFRKHL